VASLETMNEPRLSTPRHEVDHEAYLTLLAERAGVGVVPVVVAGEIDRGPAFLVRRRVEGRALSELAADEVDDALLAAIWADVERLGELRIGHHDLRAANVLVDRDGRPRISSFTLGRVGGPSVQRAQDVAEMLVSTTSVVGVRRAVDSALAALPRERLEEALPYLQWLALHRRIRNQCADAREQVTDLRETLAERLGVPVPSFRSPVRFSTALMLVAGGFAVYLLLPQLSSMAAVLDSLAAADWRWLVVAAATGMLAVAAHAVTVLGSTPEHLPPGRTLAVQVAAAFTGRTTAAGVGFFGINLAFLEKLGLRRGHVLGALLLNRAAVGFVSAVFTGLGLLVIGGAVPVGDVSVPTVPVAVGAGVVVVAGAVVLASPVGRRRIWDPAFRTVHEVLRDLLPVLKKPVRTGELFGGAVLFLLVQALGLAATLSAFGVDYPLVPVLAVFVVGTTLGQLVPTPGGLGAVEAALVAGLTALGIGSAVAVAAVLASRLLTFWLPVVPGVVAFRLLQHHEVV
jgi:undecaprenyl-diphosphatase